MKTVDRLLTNALILTMDKEFHQYDPGSVAISGNEIIAVGDDQQIKSQYNAEETVDCNEKILIPGLINAHTHVPMTLLRGLADDLRLDVWLLGYMMPVEREFVSPDFVRLGTKIACAEMIRGGITTFADMYYYEDDIAEATVEAGMRALCSQTILKFPSPDASSYEESLSNAQHFIQKWKGHPLIAPCIAPHAPYTCTDDILHSSSEIAVKFDIPLHIHIAETSSEVETMRSEHGMPVVPYLKKQNLFDAKVLAAHCVHLDEGEIRTMIHYDASAVHCPSSNTKLASGIAPIVKMLDLGLKVGIGTDGPASNNDLDMFEEMRLAAFLAKVSTGNPTALPARTVLLMGTRMGAEAMQMGDIVGSIEPGKRADLVLVDVNPVHNSPRFRRDPLGPYAQLIYATKASDVTDVIIDGKWVMRDRQLLTLNEKELLKESQSYAKKIDSFLIQREESILSKLVAIGGASQEESFEVQVKVPVTDVDHILSFINQQDIEIVYQRHYREYDTYFSFEDQNQGYLRFREDHFIDENDEVSQVRLRLTLIGPSEKFDEKEIAMVSRSRYLAPATQSLRFYREYFNPSSEIEIEKERLRYLIKYQNTEFFINIDTLNKPKLGNYLEIKSRTWSRQDAEKKVNLANELIKKIGVSSDKIDSKDYVKIIEKV